MSGATRSERALHQLCERGFLSYWTFPNPFRNSVGQAKELCDALVICDKHVLIFSDKDITFPEGDLSIAWSRWIAKSVVASVKQLAGARRMLSYPEPLVYSDKSLKKRIHLDLEPPEQRDFHLVAIANGATAASFAYFGDDVATLQLTNDRQVGKPFVLRAYAANGEFVHVFTDASLSLVMREFDTLPDLLGYLRSRRALFEGPITFMARGEEELIALYYKGFDAGRRTYDIQNALPQDAATHDLLLLDGGHWDSVTKRPEYQERIRANHESYAWDHIIEKFSKHQLDGTGTAVRPRSRPRHEGGLRYMALEPRTMRRGLAAQLLAAIEAFDPGRGMLVRTIMPEDASRRPVAYLFMQLMRPHEHTYERYREVRVNLLEIYAGAFLFNHPAIHRVVGIACDPVKLNRPPFSEDLILIERSLVTSEYLAETERRKNDMGPPGATATGRVFAADFPLAEEEAV